MAPVIEPQKNDSQGIQRKASPTAAIKTKNDAEPVKTISAADAQVIDKISLKIIQKEQGQKGEKHEKVATKTNLPENDFTYDQMLEAWNKIAEPYKADSLGLYLAMTKNKPVLSDENIVMVTTDNIIQADLVKERKPELLSKLRKALGNYTIDINATINKSVKVERAYLPTEKLQKLIEKNPAIDKLREALKLDFDY